MTTYARIPWRLEVRGPAGQRAEVLGLRLVGASPEAELRLEVLTKAWRYTYRRHGDEFWFVGRRKRPPVE